MRTISIGIRRNNYSVVKDYAGLIVAVVVSPQRSVTSLASGSWLDSSTSYNFPLLYPVQNTISELLVTSKVCSILLYL